MSIQDLVLERMDKRGGAVSHKKDRARLTVYIDSEILELFKRDADNMYRNWSDHINAILYEYYESKEGSPLSRPDKLEVGGK